MVSRSEKRSAQHAYLNRIRQAEKMLFAKRAGLILSDPLDLP